MMKIKPNKTLAILFLVAFITSFFISINSVQATNTTKSFDIYKEKYGEINQSDLSNATYYNVIGFQNITKSYEKNYWNYSQSIFSSNMYSMSNDTIQLIKEFNTTFELNQETYGENPIGWSIFENSPTDIEVVSLNERNSTLKYTGANSNIAYTPTFPHMVEGYFEFWMNVENVNDYNIISLYKQNLLVGGLTMGIATGYFVYVSFSQPAGAIITTDIIPENDVWYHINITFDCDYGWNVSIDYSEAYGLFDYAYVLNPPTYFEGCGIWDATVGGGYVSYYDGLDLSFDSSYYPNRSIFNIVGEGMIISPMFSQPNNYSINEATDSFYLNEIDLTFLNFNGDIDLYVRCNELDDFQEIAYNQTITILFSNENEDYFKFQYKINITQWIEVDNITIKFNITTYDENLYVEGFQFKTDGSIFYPDMYNLNFSGFQEYQDYDGKVGVYDGEAYMNGATKYYWKGFNRSFNLYSDLIYIDLHQYLFYDIGGAASELQIEVFDYFNNPILILDINGTSIFNSPYDLAGSFQVLFKNNGTYHVGGSIPNQLHHYLQIRLNFTSLIGELYVPDELVSNYYEDYIIKSNMSIQFELNESFGLGQIHFQIRHITGGNYFHYSMDKLRVCSNVLRYNPIRAIGNSAYMCKSLGYNLNTFIYYFSYIDKEGFCGVGISSSTYISSDIFNIATINETQTHRYISGCTQIVPVGCYYPVVLWIAFENASFYLNELYFYRLYANFNDKKYYGNVIMENLNRTNYIDVYNDGIIMNCITKYNISTLIQLVFTINPIKMDYYTLQYQSLTRGRVIANMILNVKGAYHYFHFSTLGITTTVQLMANIQFSQIIFEIRNSQKFFNQTFMGYIYNINFIEMDESTFAITLLVQFMNPFLTIFLIPFIFGIMFKKQGGGRIFSVLLLVCSIVAFATNVVPFWLGIVLIVITVFWFLRFYKVQHFEEEF